MTQLIPCPGCHRHVRQSESSCPFCSIELSLADMPAAPLPRSRLGRAATFAFGATVVGAAALMGCSGDDDDDGGSGGKGGKGGTSSAAGMSNGGNGGSTVGLVYGAPAAAGSGGDVANGGSGAAAGMSSTMGGSAAALYGSPPSGGNQNGTAGTGQFPVYGAAPAEKK